MSKKQYPKWQWYTAGIIVGLGVLFLIATIASSPDNTASSYQTALETPAPTAAKEPDLATPAPVAEVATPAPTAAPETAAPAPSPITPTEQAANNGDGTLISGEQGFVNNDVILATTKGNQDELMNYINANNMDEVRAMILDGKAHMVYKGTKITMVDSGFASHKIKVVNTGIEGYVPREFVSESSPT